MKHLYKYIVLFFVGLVAFSSCADENEFLNTGTKGDDVSLQLSFQPQTNKEVINSRATADENKLYDLHFYVFNAQGELTGYEKLVSETGDIATPGPVNVNIRTKTGESYIYAVANINKSTSYYLSKENSGLLNVTEGATSSMSDEALKTAIDNSELTRAKFLSIEYLRQYGEEGSQLYSPDPAGNIFVMSGYLNDGNSVNIQLNGNSATVDVEPIIKLYRILAKNTLTITSSGTTGKFTPKSYRLCNVPIGGILLPKANISNVATYTTNNVTASDVESSYRRSIDAMTSFTFYYPENLQTVKEGKTCTVWKDRESNDWTSGTKVYTHAADKAAYIEIYGDYVDNSGKVTANVTYTIHFGDFSNTGSMSNFNVVRNHAYTYKVTVNGVEDIKVEATTTSDDNNTNDVENPYAEGLIVDASGGSHYDVDAHYEARVLTFKKSSIQALKAANNNAGTGYILNVKTPFGETNQTVNVRADGVYSMTGVKLCTITEASNVFTGEADYLWMKFVKNTTANRTNNSNGLSTHTCKYPGDKNEFAEDYGPWMNVFELLAELYNDGAYTQNSNTEVYYTCFIDENYYNNKSWPEYVNKPSRSMLIANDLAVSEDGKSLYAKVAYSISQRSISTFYVDKYIYPKGENPNDLVIAFGTEIIDEEDIYGKRLDRSATGVGTIKDQDDWNARNSALSTNVGTAWYPTNYINYLENSQPLYSQVAKACMSRNRDLDGNGSIGENEVRWYLAAVEQYRALFYGQSSLYDSDSYLISTDELNGITRNNGSNLQRARFHYFSASADTKFIFWPEEGLSTSGNTRNYAGYGDYDYGDADLVRCIRTLESNADGKLEPEPFYTYDSDSRTFNMNGIVTVRKGQDVPLAMHDELNDNNEFYESFVVANYDLSGTFKASDVTRQNTDPCVNYKNQRNVSNTDEGKYDWRTPNQKEFALMLSEIDDLSKSDYAIRTDFSGGTIGWKTTNGFWSDNGRINVDTNGSTSGLKIRCVRDNR